VRTSLLVAIAAALLVSGCGGHSKRAAIADYITRVDAVESGMTTPLSEITQANQQYAKSQTSPKSLPKLARSVRTLETLQAKLQKITPPPEAKHLHALMLELVAREVVLAKELQSLATFVPQFQGALEPLVPANAQLKKELGKTVKGAAATKALDAEKVVALQSYATTVGLVIGTLQRFDPPAVWRPGYEAQLASLLKLRSSALALARAVAATDAKAIPTLLERFDAAAVYGQSTRVQKQQIAAVKAYDAQIKALVTLARKVQAERGRLQRTYS